MKFHLRTKGLRFSRRLIAYVEHRLSRVLGRLTRSVGDVRIAIVDSTGRRGGRGVTCRIEADSSRGPVVVTERRADPLSAISRAAGRLGKCLARELDRRRDRRRRNRRDEERKLTRGAMLELEGAA